LNEGMVVWTKLRGHPWWPSQIDKINDKLKEKKISVKFFGDNTIATVSADHIVPFEAGVTKNYSVTKKKSLMASYEEAKKFYEKKEGRAIGSGTNSNKGRTGKNEKTNGNNNSSNNIQSLKLVEENNNNTSISGKKTNKVNKESNNISIDQVLSDNSNKKVSRSRISLNKHNERSTRNVINQANAKSEEESNQEALDTSNKNRSKSKTANNKETERKLSHSTTSKSKPSKSQESAKNKQSTSFNNYNNSNSVYLTSNNLLLKSKRKREITGEYIESGSLLDKICKYLKHTAKNLNQETEAAEKDTLSRVFTYMKKYQMDNPIELLKSSQMGIMMKYLFINLTDGALKELSSEVNRNFEEQVLEQMFSKK